MKRSYGWIIVVLILSALLLDACQIIGFNAAPDSPAAPAASPVPSVTALPPTVEAPTHTALPPTAIPTQLPSPTPALPLTPAPASVKTMPYDIQLGSPKFMQAFTQLDKGCNWMGVAGQVFDSQSNPLVNVTVLVTGKLNGQTLNGVGLSGVARAYGPGGYEIKLADKAVDSQAALTIQVMDEQWQPLSAPVVFDTSSDCQKNLILVNFQGVTSGPKIFLPAVSNSK